MSDPNIELVIQNSAYMGRNSVSRLYVSSIEMRSSVPAGLRVTSTISQARENGKELSLLFGDAFGSDYPLLVQKNYMSNSAGNLLSSFNSDRLAANGEANDMFIRLRAKEQARIDVQARLRYHGMINIPSSFSQSCPLIAQVSEESLLMTAEHYSWDLFNDELDIYLISIPTADVTITADVEVPSDEDFNSSMGGGSGSGGSGSGGGNCSGKADKIHDHAGQIVRPKTFVVPTEVPEGLKSGETGMCIVDVGFGAIIPSGGGGASQLSQLTDVDILTTIPTDGQALVYDDASHKWVNRTINAGGTEVKWQEGAPIGYQRLLIGSVHHDLALDGHSHNEYLTGISSDMITNALGYTPYNSTNPDGYINGITKTMVEAVLTGNISSHTHNQYLTGITKQDVLDALEYTPYDAANPNGYITGITKTMVEDVLTGNIASHTHDQYLEASDIDGYYYPGNANGYSFDWTAKTLRMKTLVIPTTDPELEPGETGMCICDVGFGATIPAGGGGTEVYWKSGNPSDEYNVLKVGDEADRNVALEGHTHPQYITGITTNMITDSLGYTP